MRSDTTFSPLLPHIESAESTDKVIFVGSFIYALENRLEYEPSGIVPIAPLLRAACQYILTNFMKFGIDPDEDDDKIQSRCIALRNRCADVRRSSVPTEQPAPPFIARTLLTAPPDAEVKSESFDRRLTKIVSDLVAITYHKGPPWELLPNLAESLKDAGCNDSKLLAGLAVRSRERWFPSCSNAS